jgi:predicted CXXCH cytochrome family protein
MHKRWLLLAGVLFTALAAFVAFGTSTTPTALADEGPHLDGWGATPDDCSSCHRAHRAQAEAILTEEQSALCYVCHGDDAMGSALNVESGTDEDDGGALRGGGFGTARIDTDDPSLRPDPRTILALPAIEAEDVQSSHSVDSSGETIWGYGAIGDGAGLADFPLACGKCHDPHGNGNYRILRTVPAGLLHYGEALPAFMPDMDGLLADEDPPQYSTTDYWDNTYTDQWVDSPPEEEDPDDPYADTETTGRQVGRWCTTCHTRYLSPTGSGETDSGDPIFAFGHTTDPEGRDAHGRSTPVTLSGGCIQCHVAHGSNATMGPSSGDVELPDGTSGSGADDSRLLKMNNRGICQKCHNK